MIVRFLGLLTAGVIFLFATGAHAQGEDPKRWYAAGGGGGAWYNSETFTNGFGRLNADFDTGFTLNGAFGRYMDELRVIRLEVEVLYAESDLKDFTIGTKASGSVNNTALMLNVYYDIRTKSSWVPYIGGGVGYSRVEFDNVTSAGMPVVDDSDDLFAWQIKAGVAYEFNPSWTITGGYRFHKTDNPVFSDPVNGRVAADGTGIHSAELGLRFNF